MGRYEPGIHGLQGIGDGSEFLVVFQVLDEIITILTDQAKQFTLEL